jgi:hypothetical protein
VGSSSPGISTSVSVSGCVADGFGPANLPVTLVQNNKILFQLAVKGFSGTLVCDGEVQRLN